MLAARSRAVAADLIKEHPRASARARARAREIALDMFTLIYPTVSPR